MIFMILFWCVLATIMLLFTLDKMLKKEQFSDIISFLVVLQLILFFLATDDPILPLSWGVDPWWELAVEGTLAGFALWKAYLNPMKKKVYDLDREVGEIKATMTVQYTHLDKKMDTLALDLNKKFDDLSKKYDKLLEIYLKGST